MDIYESSCLSENIEVIKTKIRMWNESECTFCQEGQSFHKFCNNIGCKFQNVQIFECEKCRNQKFKVKQIKHADI